MAEATAHPALPGVVTNTPQGTDPGGEFSVNGLRTDSNNFMLDGVSAMNGAAWVSVV